ncbi:MAG: hypothetical protein CV087_06860 [Candidatus Brocadia sp. WS118]|nr:MAG: hypothetical protein CV087_06860 [Candidatus Brocadia sp. WS118]
MSLYEKFPATFKLVDELLFKDEESRKNEFVLLNNFLIPLITGFIVLSDERLENVRKLSGSQIKIRELVFGDWVDNGCPCSICRVISQLNNNAEFRLAAEAYLKRLEQIE